MKNFQEASGKSSNHLYPKKKKKSSKHNPNRSNESPNVTSATVLTPPFCALDERPVSVQSSGADRRCVFVVESMRGIEEPSKDLETLKHVLEALQLKGLLHLKNAKNQMGHQNFVYDRNGDSPIVVMKPARSPASRISRGRNESPPSSFRSRPGPRWNTNEMSPAVSPRRDRPVSVQSSGADYWCECTTTEGVNCEILFITIYFFINLKFS